MTDFLLDHRDLAFQLRHVIGLERVFGYDRFSDHSYETSDAVLETARQIAEGKFRPHNRDADLNEPHLVDGRVEILPDVRAAIAAFAEAGFLAAHHDYDTGGMQLPWTVAQAAFAYFQAANISTAAYPFLTIAAANLIRAYGTDEQKSQVLEPMMHGRWFGTMVLSEPHAGSSLSDVRTTARRQPNGTYRIRGSKMWISGGEHELSENIIHLVLARTEGAPAGVKGLSLFMVPRYRLDDGVENDVTLVGLNHKMGYRGTTNTALSFGDNDDCHGTLVGAENQGLMAMFHMMNEARIGVGMGAIMLAYTGYLHSLDYARTRAQGRHPGDKDPESPQVQLVEHVDIRRMLLLQKVIAEGGFSLGLFAANLVDIQKEDPDSAAQKEAGLLLEFVTPIIKSWFSDRALDANDAAIQIHGGYGYTREFPVEQFWRDNRLNPIHEGTNGIQAIDLLGRKVTMANGAAFNLFLAEVRKTAEVAGQSYDLAEMARVLSSSADRLEQVAAEAVRRIGAEGAIAGLANAGAFMDAAGYLTLAWIWLKQVHVAQQLLASGDGDPDFLQGKIQTCRYVFGQELPNMDAALDLVRRGDRSALDMQDQWF